MNMKTILHEDVTSWSINEPRAMLEVTGERLLDDLKARYPEKKNYLIECLKEGGTDPPVSALWNISLSRGKLWRFKLVLEVFRTSDKTFFHVSIGSDLNRNGLCFMLGMVLSLAGLLWASSRAGQSFTGDLIAPVLIGTVIGGWILSLPIRMVVRPYVMAKAREQGIEASETRLIEEVKEVLRHAG